MKRLLFLAAVVFALSATPAMAQHGTTIPHNDDDPDHWGAVFNLDLCGGQPCEISASSTDWVYTQTGMEIPPCNSVTIDWALPLGNRPDTLKLIDYEQDGFCPGNLPEMTGCVYSPSGFTNGSADIEFWLSAGSTWFFPVTGDAVGNYVYRFDSYEWDVEFDNGGGLVTLDGTFDIDPDPVLVEHDRGATPCSYSQLS